MIGKSFNDFLDTLSTGCEMEFLYNNRYFIIQGEVEKGLHCIRIDECPLNENIEFDFNNAYRFKVTGKSFDECVKQIITIPLIDGKKLSELEQDVTVLFG